MRVVQIILATLGAMSVGMPLGFFCLVFIANTVEGPPRGPSPYPGLGSIQLAQFFGIPLGMLMGFLVSVWWNRRQRIKRTWNSWTWLGIVLGAVVGPALSPIVREFYADFGREIGVKEIGIVPLVFAWATVGGSLSNLAQALFRRFRKPRE